MHKMIIIYRTLLWKLAQYLWLLTKLHTALPEFGCLLCDIPLTVHLTIHADHRRDFRAFLIQVELPRR